MSTPDTTFPAAPYLTGAKATPDLAAQIDAIVQEIRPAIQRDGGDIELVCIDGDVIRVRLAGACVHCSLAAQTLGGVRREISRRLGVAFRVLPAVSD
jgi:Fe-S cluster biogenesis protein NfuA